MLKLQKIKHSQDIKICLREKDRFFDRTLCFAFFLALILHGMALVVFQIQPFKIISSYLFSPVMVDVNRSKGSDIQLIKLSNVKNETPVLLPPFPSPKIPSISYTPTDQFSLISTQTLTNSSFGSIEHLSDLSSISAPLRHLSYRPVTIIVSGPLAQQPLLEKSSPSILSTDWIKEEGLLSYFHIKYLVQVDPRSGHIFWLDKKQSSGQLPLDQWAEKTLLALQFETSINWENIQGEIDLIVALDEKRSIKNLIQLEGNAN